jgi:uncharacterized protein (TIGR02646 family)
MIQVCFEVPTDAAWVEWRSRCDGETALLVVNGRPEKFNEPLYKSQREWLNRIFRGKCAYCESRLTGNQPGDVEHFRPKGRIQVELLGGTEHKPGYYWLAYETSNLLIACDLCNSSFKREKFPLADESLRAQVPGEEKREVPLLFHPVNDDPAMHVVFDPMTGFLAAKDEQMQAKTTIEMLGLNLRKLPDLRRKAYQSTRRNVDYVLGHWITGGDQLQDAVQDLRDIETGEADFAFARRWALRELRSSVESLFATLNPLLRLSP